MQKKAAIVTLNWNGLELIKNCLSSVYKQTYTNFSVYLTDNGSTDGSVEFIKKNYPQIDFKELGRNTGFAKASNEGIRLALSDPDVEYIVCLNNDTIVDPQWLQALIDQVDYEKKIDMVASLALFEDGNVQSAGLFFDKNLMGAKVGGLSRGYGENPSLHAQVKEVFAPSAGACLYTRRMLEDVGLFDEDFFIYDEDFDLGLRAKNKGYRCVFTPFSKLIHLHSRSTGGAASPFKAFLAKRNAYFVAIKNFGIIDLILFPFRDIIWNIKSLFPDNKGKNTSTKQLINRIGFARLILLMIKMYAQVLWYFPKMLIKRFKAQKF